MNPNKSAPFCLADRTFFESPERIPDQDSRFELSRRAVPAGWRRVEHGFWVMLNGPDNPLPRQGWKIHVSSTLADAERVLEIVWNYCADRGVAFKFLRSRQTLLVVNAKDAARGGSGKLMTIYPIDEQQLTGVLTELSELLAGFDGPYILSDLRFGAGPLYVRYGAFVTLWGYDAHGDPVPALQAPDGTLVPDVRGTAFAAPQWAALPAVLRPHLAARLSSDVGEWPYDVQRALQFSNGGGVYVAEDRRDGATVVLREARPHAGLDRRGVDAVARLRDEHAVLARLDGLPCVPRLLGYHVVWEHHFLVEEYVPGQTLLNAVVSRHPFVHPDPDPDEVRSYLTWAMDVVGKVAQALAAVHGRGIRFGDLHPGNILIRPDGDVVLVDFELAANLDDESPPALAAPGFAAPPGVHGAEVDRYALDCVRLFVLMPMMQMLQRDPAKAATLAGAAGELFPGAPPLGRRLHERLRSQPDDRAVALFAGGKAHWPAIRDAIVAGIHAGATPERADRLFPGDPQQFVTGGLTLDCGAAGVLYALHQVGAPVPAEYVDWLTAAARRAPRVVRNGLYDGLHGVALTLDLLGNTAAALEVLDLARAGQTPRPAVGLAGGRAGVALNLLHFAVRTGDDAMRGEAARIADDLAALLGGDEPRAGIRIPRRAGLMNGMTGPAVLFLRLHELTGVSRYLDLARAALQRDLDRCVLLADGTLQVRHESTHLPYLGHGSGGIGVVARQYLRHRDDTELAAALEAIRLASRTAFVFEPGLLKGRAGLITTLTHLEESISPPYVHEHVRRLSWHALSDDGRVHFPGSGLLRASLDLGTGSAGVLLALHGAYQNADCVLPCVGAPSPARYSSEIGGR